MMHFTLQYTVELLGFLSLLAVSVGIGFALVKSFLLIRGERTLAVQLTHQSNSVRVAQLLTALVSESADSALVLSEIEQELRNVPTKVQRMQRREIFEALSQPNERGRRAYASKLLSNTKPTKPVAVVESRHRAAV